jgi:mannose-6-phosphate isomerase-like protein (cupin superfamily)
VTAGAGATVRTVLDTVGGLVRRQVEVPAGARHTGAAGPGGERCFVIGGAGQLSFGTAPDGTAPDRPVQPDTGVWLPPGTSYSLAAAGPGPLRLDSVLLPASAPVAEPDGAGPDGTAGPLLADLAGQPAEITGDRQFRILFAPGQGCAAATQFVGEIPPGRAPFHSHTYDEVVLILAGEGVLHIGGDEDRPLAPGSCLHLAPGTPHCLENTGQATLRVLGVFHPGGSPAAKKPASG